MNMLITGVKYARRCVDTSDDESHDVKAGTYVLPHAGLPLSPRPIDDNA